MSRFPIARRTWTFAKRARRNWLERHQSALSFWIHMIGIPVALSGIVMLFLVEWYWGVGCLLLGYGLQWVGHRYEGNDVGEFIPIKKLLGMPYTSIAPRYTLPKQD